MVITTLQYMSGEREDRSYLEAELVIDEEWALMAQESLGQLQSRRACFKRE